MGLFSIYLIIIFWFSIEEIGIDGGGVFKEFFLTVCK